MVGRLLHGGRSRLCLALASATALLALTLWGDSSAYVLGDEGITMKQYEVIHYLLGGEGEPLPQDFLAVNIGYDRELVAVHDEMGMPMGHTDITSRRSLLRFLQICDSTQGYTAIAIDVTFDAALRTPSDRALYRLIARMPRVVVPRSSGEETAGGIPADKQARSDYATSYSDQNFVKYTFRYADGEPALATRAMQMAAGRMPQRRAGAGASLLSPIRRDKMCLPLNIRLDGAYYDNGEKTYYNLGADLLDACSAAEIARLVEGKTIVVGDFTTNDFHDTYMGPTAGAVIIINAMQALRQGSNHTSLAALIILFAVYLLISLVVVGGTGLIDIPWRGKWAGSLRSMLGRGRAAAARMANRHRTLWKWARFVVALASYTTVLSATQTLLYLCLGEFHDTYFATLWLSALYLACDIARTRRTEK